jgi:hypothetical protein
MTRVILATPAASVTARNATASGSVRLALGDSRDVTIIDATAAVVPCADAPDTVADCYAARTGRDPPHDDPPHVYLIAMPRVMRAWHGRPPAALSTSTGAGLTATAAPWFCFGPRSGGRDPVWSMAACKGAS